MLKYICNILILFCHPLLSICDCRPTAKGRKAMFCVGEKICYPMHGIGEIEGIEERTVLGITAQ